MAFDATRFFNPPEVSMNLLDLLQHGILGLSGVAKVLVTLAGFNADDFPVFLKDLGHLHPGVKLGVVEAMLL